VVSSLGNFFVIFLIFCSYCLKKILMGIRGDFSIIRFCWVCDVSVICFIVLLDLCGRLPRTSPISPFLIRLHAADQ
jgi:hypothetical protein